MDHLTDVLSLHQIASIESDKTTYVDVPAGTLRVRRLPGGAEVDDDDVPTGVVLSTYYAVALIAPGDDPRPGRSRPMISVTDLSLLAAINRVLEASHD